jgi:hypothetical protein
MKPKILENLSQTGNAATQGGAAQLSANGQRLRCTHPVVRGENRGACYPRGITRIMELPDESRRSAATRVRINPRIALECGYRPGRCCAAGARFPKPRTCVTSQNRVVGA